MDLAILSGLLFIAGASAALGGYCGWFLGREHRDQEWAACLRAQDVHVRVCPACPPHQLMRAATLPAPAPRLPAAHPHGVYPCA